MENDQENSSQPKQSDVKTESNGQTFGNIDPTIVSDSNTFVQPGFWMIDPSWFQKAIKNLQSGCTFESQLESFKSFQSSNGVAVIDMVGPMTKGFNPFGGTPTSLVRQSLRDAVADDSIDSILLNIDSPGGHVAGTQQLADDVRVANTQKPVFAHIEDLGASAAFWVASQARSISANSTAEVGSIGTVAVVEDFSGMMEQMGIKVHVISTGKFKGAFVGGAEVTEEHLADLQERIDDLNEIFLSAVSDGRGLTGKDLKAVSDGRVHIASKALDLGLIDEVKSIEGAFESIMALKGNAKKDRRKTAETLIRLSEI